MSAQVDVLEKLQRWYPSLPVHPGWQMSPHPDGEWVLFADVQALRQQSTPIDLEQVDRTDRELLVEFIRICREHKPVGQWPGERLCTAIERMMEREKPFRFIAEADMAPERGHNGRGGDADRPFSGPRRAAPRQPAPVVDDELPGMWSQSDFMGGATDAADNARQPAPVAGDAMADVLAALKDARTFVTHAHCQIAAPIGTLEKYDAATAAVNELIEVAAQIKARLDARRAKAFAERGGWQWHSREDEGDYERLCAALARAQGVQS